MEYSNYHEMSEAQIKAEVSVEQERLRQETNRYKSRVDDRESRREQLLVGLAIVGVTAVLLSFIWAIYLYHSSSSARKDALRNNCQVSGGTWVKVDYNAYTCVPQGSNVDIEKIMYKEDD